MTSEDLKRRLEALDKYLEEMEDIDPEDPFFLLVVFTDGMRYALKTLLRVNQKW